MLDVPQVFRPVSARGVRSLGFSRRTSGAADTLLSFYFLTNSPSTLKKVSNTVNSAVVAASRCLLALQHLLVHTGEKGT